MSSCARKIAAGLAATVTILVSGRAHAPYCDRSPLLGNPPPAIDTSLSIFEEDGGGCIWARHDIDRDPVPILRMPVPCRFATAPRHSRNRQRALVGYYDLGVAPAFHAFEADFDSAEFRAFPPYPLRGLTPETYLPEVGYAADDEVLLERTHHGVCVPYRFQFFGLGCSSSIVELRTPSIDGWQLRSWLRKPGRYQAFFDWREVGGTWRSTSRGDGFAALPDRPTDATAVALHSQLTALCPGGWPEWSAHSSGSTIFAETNVAGGGKCLAFAKDSTIILVRRVHAVWGLETQGDVLLTRAPKNPSGAVHLYDVRSGRELFATENSRAYFWPARDF